MSYFSFPRLAIRTSSNDRHGLVALPPTPRLVLLGLLLQGLLDAHVPLDNDARLVFNVANAEERRVLDDYIARTVYAETPFSLLRLFTRHPIHTRRALDGLGGSACFASGVDVEVDVGESYYALGHDAALGAWEAAPYRKR